MLARAVRDIRDAAKEVGRDPYDIRLFAGATVIVAPTRAEAHDLLAEYAEHIDQTGCRPALRLDRHRLLHLSPRSGRAICREQRDPVDGGEFHGAERSPDQGWRPSEPQPNRRALALRDRITQDVANELIAWADETDVDGFNLFRLVAPESLDTFVDLVVPELQSRGVYKTEYREGTLREKLFSGRGPRLHVTHPGAGYRHAPSSAVRSDAAE